MYRQIINRFYVRLSVVLFLLLILTALVFVLITFRIFESKEVEIDQRVNRNLAADMTAEIEPFLERNLDKDKIGNAIHYMMVLNPAVEIYLLDGDGRILAFYASEGKSIRQQEVDTEPLEAFIHGTSELPIYGDDPRMPGEEKHFSAAPVTLPEGERGYLYVVLRSSTYDTASDMFFGEYQRRAILTGLAVSFPPAALLGLVLFFYITKRLQSLTRTVRHFGEGNYGLRSDVGGKDEIGELARCFNGMADTLVASIRETEKANRLKRELTANISHDLRNPLASLQGYLETLSEKDDTLSGQERMKYIRIMLKNTNALKRLIDDLFQFAKLESGNVKPDIEAYSQSELAQDVLLKMKPRAEKEDIELEMKRPDELFLVRADIAMIERVLTNLLENGIKNTPPGGTVGIETERREGKVITRVFDTGYGIAEEELSAIFDMFYTGDKSRDRSREGSGLGLGICKKIIELHGEEIRVSSTPGKGSTFSFSLPAKELPAD